MIQISKTEAAYLASKGFRFGDDIHHTHTSRRQRKYYLTESARGVKELRKYREAKVIGL